MPEKLSSHELTTSLLIKEEAFQALREPWNQLAEKLTEPSVFARHEWFDAAWQWRRTASELWILTVHRDNKLIGIAPLLRQKELRSGLPVRRLGFLTVPDTQFCQILVSPEDQSTVLEAIAEGLQRQANEWDLLELTHLTGSAATIQQLQAALEHQRLRPALSIQEYNPLIRLSQDWETYYKSRSRRLKKGNNLVANRLNKTFQTVEVTHIIDCEEHRELLHTLVDISANSWKTTTGTSLNHSGPYNFIRRLTEHAQQQGWLSIWLLELDGQAVAMEYQLVYSGAIHALRADFDQKYQESSPGTYLNWYLLQRLFSLSFEYYWMGPGENDYKRRWAEVYTPLTKLRAYSPNLRGQILAFRDHVLQPFAYATGRRLRFSQRITR